MIIKILWNKRVDACDIADSLQGHFGEHAYQLGMIRFWIAEARLDRQDLHAEIRTGRPSLDDLDARILATSDKFTFKSAHSIAEGFTVDDPRVVPYLHDFIDFQSFHLSWRPHPLPDYSCEKQKADARAMLPFLSGAERDSWRHLVIRDESWFFFNM
jgi:hypothetical protein